MSFPFAGEVFTEASSALLIDKTFHHHEADDFVMGGHLRQEEKLIGDFLIVCGDKTENTSIVGFHGLGEIVSLLRSALLKKGANMPCEIVEKEEGLITIKITGVLKRAELAQAEKVAIEAMGSAQKVKFLILTENFQGWDNRDNWEDVSFQSQYDQQIEKIAIVGEKKWQDLAEAFVGKGLRSMDIRYFAPTEMAMAKTWIK